VILQTNLTLDAMPGFQSLPCHPTSKMDNLYTTRRQHYYLIPVYLKHSQQITGC
jgi:hypothetical protein